jgi:hypothetical protein
MTLMDAGLATYRDLASGSRQRRSGLHGNEVGGAFPAKMVVDLSWLADPLSIAVLNTALAVAVLWVGGFWEPLT